jgi:purine-cytosine permease-like protein
MQNNDGVRDDDSVELTIVRLGSRRVTYTPPTHSSLAPPVRRSLADEELASLLADPSAREGGTLGLIEQFEQQLRLREQDAQRFSEWEDRMRSFGVGDSASEVQSVRSQRQARSATIMPTDTGEIIVAEVVELEPVEESGDLSEVAPAGFVFGSDGSGSRTAVSSEPATSFDDVLNGSPGEEPPRQFDSEQLLNLDPGAESLFIEPMPVAAGEDIPSDTGSISVIHGAYELELDDDVDDTDRAFVPMAGAIIVDAAGISEIGSLTGIPQSEPVSVIRLRDEEPVILDNAPVRTRVFSIETVGIEPTPADRRIGRAARLFWLWFAANSSILSLALGAVIFGLGMSLRQTVVAVVIGLIVSCVPLGLSALAGKRSGQPTMIVSRATFGVLGNVLPSVLALVTRIFWAAVLLWLLASSVEIILEGADSVSVLGDPQLFIVSLVAALVVALVIAFAGYPLLARVQLIVSILSAILVAGLVVMTVQYVDLGVALDAPDGSWLLITTGAVLVFSFVGLVWANSGADLARYQRPGSTGALSTLWSALGATVPAFILIAYGALLAASDPGLARGFAAAPLETLSAMLPGWYPIPLLAATALSLLSGVVLTLYSGSFAMQSIGIRLSRPSSVIVVGGLAAILALVFTFAVTGGMAELFRDLATTLAVPTAAWAGIFVAEILVRSRSYDSASLMSRGGVYSDVRWVNLAGLIVITAVSWGLTSATVMWLQWQGYLFTAIGVPLDGELAGTDVGVLVALGLGLVLPIVAGIPAIRRQEDSRAQLGATGPGFPPQ